MTRESLFALIVAVLGLPVSAAAAAKPVDFRQQIRPLLTRACVSCHGPDEQHRKAGLRLDTRDGAFREKDGTHAVVAGDLKRSEIWRRLVTADPDDVMPPPDSGKSLSADERGLIRRWIEEGANWRDHWSFEAVARTAVPGPSFPAVSRGPLDDLVHAQLVAQGLRPSPVAAPHELVRRLAFDLTGLPPTPDDTARFVRDPSDKAYEALVDRFLADPGYGERWARVWLDLARFADSKGYEKDQKRTIWRYRDWVIDAYNRDLPFSDFTVQQLAGDLMPDAKPATILATAFHRNTLTNDEGGTDDEEFRVAAVKDRVDTTLQVWMGLTGGCAKCHDHKYDPISAKEYYRLFAFFNQTADADLSSDEPVMAFPTDDQEPRRKDVEARVAVAEAAVDRKAAPLHRQQKAWEEGWLASHAKGQRQTLGKGSVASTKFEPWQALGPIAMSEAPAAIEGAAFDLATAFRGVKWRPWAGREGRIESERVGDRQNVALYLAREATATSARTVRVRLSSDEGMKMWVDGKVVFDGGPSGVATFELSAGKHQVLLRFDSALAPVSIFVQMEEETIGGEAIDIARTLLIDTKDRTAADRVRLRDLFLRRQPGGPPPKSLRLADLRAERDRVNREIPQIPILKELPPHQRRATHFQVRGNFLEKGAVLEAGVPAAFHALPIEAPRNRLGLARWIMDPRNPLTARVQVNRLWAQLFGAGLVETEEDFGTQGMPPSHPELLDWLAGDLVAKGWSQKKFLKTVVMSATYRQSANASPAALSRDRWNRWLARGPRFRLEAEMIRDAALSVSGLLSPKLHGPSAMPPQPDGIWAAVYSTDRWVTPISGERWRRGLYTWIRRTSPYPSLLTFDAPSREICTIRRIRSNTPLQALVTLNDPVYVEAAQALARRAIKESGPAGSQERIAHAFRLSLGRPPTPAELSPLVRLYDQRLAHYRAHSADATLFATQPLGPLPVGIDASEAAALTAVSNVILNLDEFLVKG